MFLDFSDKVDKDLLELLKEAVDVSCSKVSEVPHVPMHVTSEKKEKDRILLLLKMDKITVSHPKEILRIYKLGP